MAFLSKLLGRRSPEAERAEADGLYDAGEFGRAKLVYERVLDKLDKSDPQIESVKTRIASCRDGIARERMHEAQIFLDTDRAELAHTELIGALEIAAGEDIRNEAQRMIDAMEREDAVASAAAPAEITREEKLALLAAGWEEEQAEEYEQYGEALEDALLALHADDSKTALASLEELLASAKDPRYLHFEIGRARLMQSSAESGEEALRTFLSRIGPDEGGDARLVTHVELARIADERGDFDAAMAEYEAAMEALSEDPRPYLGLGQFLRAREHFEEAIEVLESAASIMDQQQADWRIIHELGLAHAGKGDDDAAIRTLEHLVTMLAARRVFDLPTEGTIMLAQLHEKQGRLERAADLYSALSRGSDRANHLKYHREAARLLQKLELPEESRRMLQRAAALAGENQGLREEIEQEIRELG